MIRTARSALLFAATVALVSVHSTEARAQVISFEKQSPSPQYAALSDLIGHGLPITLVSVWTNNPNDIVDYTDRYELPSGWRPAKPIYGRPEVTLAFTYDPTATPDRVVNAELAARAMVDAYNALDHVAKYQVRVETDRVLVEPTHVRAVDGTYTPYVPITSLVVDLPKAKLPFTQALHAVLDAVRPQLDHNVHFELHYGESSTKVKVGGTQTVRDHLLSIYRQAEEGTDTLHVWEEGCDAKDPVAGCGFSHTYLPRPPPPPSPTVLCYPEFNNDYVLGVVQERTGALDGYTCRPDPVVVRNGLELYEYGLDLGWDGQTFADLEIRFNVEGTFEASSACSIRMTGDEGVLDVHSDRMCLVGRRGVDVGTHSTAVIGAEADAVYFNSALGAAVVAPNTAITTRFFAVEGLTGATVGEGSEIVSEDVVIRSLGDVADSKVELGEGVRITGQDIAIEASRGVALGPSVAIDATGAIAIRSLGGSEAGQISVGAGATLTATNIDTISLESSGPVTIGAGATLSADLALRIESPACTIDPSATVAAPTQSGSYLELGPPPPDPTCAAFACQSGKVQLCHKPGQPAQKTLCVSSSGVPAHLGHGDVCGPCPSGE